MLSTNRFQVGEGRSVTSVADDSCAVVAIDAVGIDGGGGREVAYDAVAAVERHPRIREAWLFVSDAELATACGHFRSVNVVDLGRRGLLWRYWWWNRGAIAAAAGRKCDSVLHLANVAVGGGRGVRRSVLVHQPNIFSRPERGGVGVAQKLRYALLRRLIIRSVRSVDRVFVQTSVVARQLEELAKGDIAIELAPPSAPSSLPAVPRDVANRGQASFLYIGSAASHKNVGLLLEAAPLLRARNPEARVTLTIDPPDTAMPPGVECVGPLSRQEVAEALSHATALVMPSLSETVGLPMLEAMALDVPVIAADRPYAHAICGDAATYFDPLSPEALADVCDRLVRDKALQEDLVNAGRAATRRMKELRGDNVMAAWLAGP